MTNAINKSDLFALAWKTAKRVGGGTREAFAKALRQAWVAAKNGMLAFELAITYLPPSKEKLVITAKDLGRWNGSAFDMGSRRSRRYVSQGSYGGGIYRE